MQRMLQNGLGQRIRKLRLEMGMTIDEFSELIDVSPGYLGLVERGKREFTTKRLTEISRIFNVSLAYLILGEQAEEETEHEYTAPHTALKNLEIILKTTHFTEAEYQFFYDLLRAYTVYIKR